MSDSIPNAGGRTYTNSVLTVVAVLLGFNLLARSGDRPAFVGVSEAQVSTLDDTGGRISAAEQRKQIIAELQNVGRRVEHLESMLSKGLSVKVTEMPAVRMAGGQREASRESSRDQPPREPVIKPSGPSN